MVVVAACRKEQRAWIRPHDFVEAERPVVEGFGRIEIADVEGGNVCRRRTSSPPASRELRQRTWQERLVPRHAVAEIAGRTVHEL